MSIVFIRHGEKPKDTDNIHLSKDGQYRAKNLTKLLKIIPIPNIIIAMKQETNNKSNRPYETVKYLASELGLPVWTEYTRDQTEKLIDFVNKNNNKNILICWEHNVLADIIQKITNVDINWHSDDYDSLYIYQNKILIHMTENI